MPPRASVLLATLLSMELRGGLKTSMLMLALTAGLATGCGRANTIYSDPAPACADTVKIDDGPSVLPNGLLDQSTNSGAIQITNPGSTNSSLRLSGQRAILGLTNYDSTPLSDLNLEFTTADSKRLTIALQIDRFCDSSQLETVLIENVSNNLQSDAEEILAESPQACLRNGVPTLSGLPAFSSGAILLMNGSPESSVAESIDLLTLKIQSESFTAWGAQ